MFLKPIIKRKTAQKIIRNDPKWSGLNPLNPFLINMNELPQIRASTSRINHFSCIDFISVLIATNFVIILRIITFIFN